MSAIAIRCDAFLGHGESQLSNWAALAEIIPNVASATSQKPKNKVLRSRGKTTSIPRS
jgi:hypothetical protein